MLTSPMRMLGHRARHGAARGGLRRARVRDPRPRAADDRPGGRAAASGRPRRRALRPRHVRLRRRRARPARGQLRGRGGPRRSRSWARTGSGKTTLASLVPRLYDPVEGRVLIDGADVRRSTSSRCGARSRSSPTTRSCSRRRLRENIAYARPDATDGGGAATPPRAPGWPSSSTALPDGYDTRVGERGLTLSGGQRQRVAIARALVANPRILILDDATSSVDATTESRIKEALREVMEGRTTFVIAHRLSTISLADEIVVLEDGPAGRARHARGAARVVAALPRDRREGPAGRRLPDREPASSARWRACEGAHALASGCCCAARTSARASCAGCSSCCGPYRAKVALMFVALLLATAASLVPPYLAGRAIDDGIRERDADFLTVILIVVHRRRADQLGRDLRADLPRQLGRPARAPGPARADLRPPPAALDRLLLAQQDRRPDLAADERRAGARPARHRRRGHAVLVHAHPARHRGDPAASSTPSWR